MHRCESRHLQDNHTFCVVCGQDVGVDTLGGNVAAVVFRKRPCIHTGPLMSVGVLRSIPFHSKRSQSFR